MMKIQPKRAAVDFDPELHQTLSIKAAETQRSLSDLVNQAVRLSLAEDAADLATFEQRKDEPDLRFADVVGDLKSRGRL